MIPKRSKKSMHLRLNTQSGGQCKSIKKNSRKPKKSPKHYEFSTKVSISAKNLQNNRGGRWDSKAVKYAQQFSLNSLLNKGNKTSGRSYRQIQKTTLDQGERKDLQLLNQWTDNMTQQLEIQHYGSIQEFYDKMEIIYSGAVSQLSSQLAVKCNDYSLLLEKIWSFFTGAVKEIIEKQSVTNRRLEKDSLSETIKLHELYQKTLNEKLRKLQEAEDSSKRNHDWAEKMNKENRYLRKKARKLEQELSIYRNDQEILKLQLKEVTKENETLKLFQNQQVRKHKVRKELTFEQLEVEFEEELFRAKKEIFEDFKRTFENQTHQFEQAYQRRVQELEKNDDKADYDEMMVDDYQEILFKDQCVGNNVQYETKCNGTQDLHKLEDAFTQTILVKKKIVDMGMQTTMVSDNSVACEANYPTIKRECLPRTSEEQTYLEMAHYPIHVFIDDYFQLRINKQEIDKKGFNDILLEQLNTLKYRSQQIFNIMKFKEEFHVEDFQTINEYFEGSYEMFIHIIKDFQDLQSNLKEELISRKIQIFEAQLSYMQSKKQKQFTEKKFDILGNKYQTSVKQFKFLLKQIKLISRFIPQYQLDQLKRRGKKQKIIFEFQKQQPISNKQVTESFTHLPSFEKPAVYSSQMTLEKTPQLQTQQTLNLPIVPIQHIQRKSLGGYLPEVVEPPRSKSSLHEEEEESDSGDQETMSPLKPQINLFFPECTQEETQSEESDQDDIDLDAELNPIKSLLTVEKKLFLSRCPSKNTQVATNTLLQEIQNFRRDKKDGLQKLVTLQKQLIQFVAWCLKFNKFHLPFHIQLYEQLSSENFSSPQSVWLQKLARVVKSLIYYKRKNAYAQFFHDMMVGDLNFSKYLSVLNNIATREFSENSIIVPQTQFVDSINTFYKSALIKNATFIDFDSEIQYYLKPIQQNLLAESKLKWSLILEIFEERFNITQFSNLLQEIQPHKIENYYSVLFQNQCDIEQNGITYMTTDRFVIICSEFQLMQNLPAYIKKNDFQYFYDLELWKKREIELKLMLIRSKTYDGAERDFFLKMYKLNPEQRIILGRYLEKRAKDILLQTYTLECLSPFMLHMNKIYE